VDYKILETVGRVAGIGGLALGVFVLLFRDVIRKNVFPQLTKDQAFHIIRLFLFLTFTIATLGIVWVYVSTFAKQSNQKEQQSEKQGAAFALGAERVLMSRSEDTAAGFWIAYKGPYGDVICPANLAVFLRVVNLQQVPSMIEAFAVELPDPNHRWVKLSRMDARRWAVYWALELRRARRVDVANSCFDAFVGDRSLQPRETVRGWALFELPKGVEFVLPLVLRIAIRDTLGMTTAEVVPVMKPVEHDDVLSRGFRLIGPEVNLSRHRQRHLRDELILPATIP